MLEGLPFLFLGAEETDSYFDDNSGSGDNLNNSDPDLLPDQNALECDAAYDEYDNYSHTLDEFKDLEDVHVQLQEEHKKFLYEKPDQDTMSGVKNTMRYGMPLLETLHEGISKNMSPVKQPQSIREALTESRQGFLPKRSFERLVARVCSGEVKRNNVG